MDHCFHNRPSTIYGEGKLFRGCLFGTIRKEWITVCTTDPPLSMVKVGYPWRSYMGHYVIIVASVVVVFDVIEVAFDLMQLMLCVVAEWICFYESREENKD